MANMELITSVTVGSGGAASVTLPATGTIPQTYTDLKIVMSVRGDQAATYASCFISFNGSSTGFVHKFVYGEGAIASSFGGNTNQIADQNGDTSTSNTFSNTEIYIPNYTLSNSKSFSVDGVTENNATTAFAELGALVGPSAAITSITISPSSTKKWLEHSTFYLYGISNVTSGSKATGGIVSSDGTYWYHMFPYSGTFTPTSAISADVLCIAGGGGGGDSRGGGGGAGGYRYLTSQSLTATGYTVTVGAGGAKGSSASGNNGGNSSISTISATGGGGGAITGTTGENGGSGGGGGGTPGASGGTGNTGSYSPVEGFAGGAGDYNSSYGRSGGGGGGSGSIGSSGSSPGRGGAGGNGTQNTAFANATQTGVNTYYAGGGAGGTGIANAAAAVGGSGGGGNGGTDSPLIYGTNGVANTGSGGGGAGASGSNGNGGSGLVIIRYAI